MYVMHVQGVIENRIQLTSFFCKLLLNGALYDSKMGRNQFLLTEIKKNQL